LNKAKVSRFFDVLEKVCLNESAERIIPYTNIYNVDESGFTCVQKPQKTVATKGKKNVRALTSGEKKTLTAVCCISATCAHIPPTQEEVQTSKEMKKRKKENNDTQKKKALKVGRK